MINSFLQKLSTWVTAKSNISTRIDFLLLTSVIIFRATTMCSTDSAYENSIIIIIGDVYCPTCRNEKCVYISTKKMNSFYYCKKCKACCLVLNFPFKVQKPTIMLFGGDGTHCFARKTSRDYEKPCPFLKKFLRQSQPSTFEPEPKKMLRRVQI